MKTVRIVVFNLLCVSSLIFALDDRPNVTIVAFKPKGIRISIPYDPEIKMFIFRGNINKPLGRVEPGTIFGRVRMPDRNQLIYFEDSEVKLNVGDIIYYYIFILKGDLKFYEYYLTYIVTELRDIIPSGQSSVDPINPTTGQETQETHASSECISSATRISGRSSSFCSGQILFEDDFNALNEDIWKIEQYIPTSPDYPFVSYQRPANAPTVSVKDGMLRIEPKLQHILPGFDTDSIISNGNILDLTRGCTRSTCTYMNSGAQIMPPIASGRLTTPWFSFKYGVVEVRAKLPQGDWLYPDIILEPHENKYGFENYASGILRVAGALGNMVLTKGSEEYSNKALYAGPIMDFKCRTRLLATNTSESPWGDDFHVYSLQWAPDGITLYVDGERYGNAEPAAGGFRTQFPVDSCDPPRKSLDTPLAPFDDFFRITLGVSAGGVSEFPDGVTGPRMKPKPWKNKSHRAKLSFFEDLASWYPTWYQSALLVDYIRVHAL